MNITYRYVYVQVKELLSYKRKKQISLPNNEYPTDCGCEGSNMAANCKIFLLYHFIDMYKNKYDCLQGIFSDGRCERTNMVSKCKIFVNVT